MDYLARLIAGAAAPNKPKTDTPAERLSTCIKLCNSLRNLWQRGSVGPEDDAAASRAVELLTRLNNLLTDESRKAAPHSCLLHIITNQTYIIIVKLALESQNPDVINHTAQFFHILINGEGEGLLDNKLFSRSLLDLVKSTVTGSQIYVDVETENDLIELLFEIATKIRLDPDILSAWFHPERDRSRPRAPADVRRNQFPLFFVLVQYVHDDGQTGDFARTGLLYLTETASRSKQLETWMIESDLAPQMASGLGALYSRLSRQFPPLEASEMMIPIIALSDATPSDSRSKETRDGFTRDLKEFMTYLAFWQDTVNRCKSQDVEDTLLDHFQVLFVQQLLYPSLLESSDVSGGSTAAVIAHLARILMALEPQKLAQRMLQYLLAAKAADPDNITKRPRARFSMSRRKSLDTLAALAEAAQSPSPDLFNLLDLITMSLKSKHSYTVNSCLKLLSVILTRHHPSALSAMFRLESLDETALDKSMSIFNESLTRYFDQAAEIARDETTLDESYQASLTDAKFRIERHSCSTTATSDGQALIKVPTSIHAECKLLNALLDRLETLFSNDTLTNLGLTQCIMDVAACENISVHGWLVPLRSEPPHRNVTSVIEKLNQQIKRWRGFFPEWDNLIAKRRDELSEADSGSDVRSPSGPSDPVVKAQSTPPRSIQGSRPVTPTTATRGRPLANAPTFGSIDNTIASSPTPNPRTPLAQRPLAGSPLRQAYFSRNESSSSPSRLERSASQKATELNDSPASEVSMNKASENDLEALLKTMITLDIESGDMPEESSPLLPVHAGRSHEDGRSPTANRSLLTPGDGLGGSGTVTPTPSAVESEDRDNKREISLSHILTNAVILQEFILEIAAMVQIRGTMIGEVDLA
ncbi:uncharacterized protein HMPREF1541_02170 [Cyphellophora europaea CBS 101466]|uniref:FHF complex subunit HOOK-interacting protein C-terminal domain-containing protein n=1 Tax=Cyphellophora europaea (strain CBS 101466) TaxID=1220924 RepID=W2S2V1_CYPE1|nr:uncharacterized protein HMPREF1541_02170 [Cyphellophora europaea CBS 101466]ETN43012.1 hypothetical protein HMPREF1541_02170 [Cyphellophora europaea CBS 101466]